MPETIYLKPNKFGELDKEPRERIVKKLRAEYVDQIPQIGARLWKSINSQIAREVAQLRWQTGRTALECYDYFLTQPQNKDLAYLNACRIAANERAAEAELENLTDGDTDR